MSTTLVPANENTAVVPRGKTDLTRYHRVVQGGESIEEIAASDGITIAQAKQSVAQGERVVDMQARRQLTDLRNEAAIENEKIRKSVRAKFGVKLEDALDLVLSGKRIVVEVDKISGKVEFKDYTDPDLVLAGIEQLRKTVSLEEKPAAPIQATIINNTQNNNNNGSAERFDFETRIAQIRQQQAATDAPPIDAEIVTPETEASEPADPEPKGDQWTDF